MCAGKGRRVGVDVWAVCVGGRCSGGFTPSLAYALFPFFVYFLCLSFLFLWFLTDEFPVSSALPSPGQGVWRLMVPPPPTPRPHLPPLPPPHPPNRPPHHFPRPHTPWAAVPYPPHVTSITARPPPAYSAQTHNVLTVDRLTTTTTTTSSSRTAGNSHGSFPVSVIPSDNSSHHAVDTQIQSPLLESGHGAGRRVNASRAANVLGNAYGLQRTDPHAST